MKKTPHVGLARKYRPQLFEDVVGQEAVSTTLRNAVETQQVAHGYLFYGPRGVGKTTSARILAKALNCAKGPAAQPCGECPSCREIAAGISIDVLELDAASNTQVEKVREMIIETVALAPSRDRHKIFIIDEVHMLSASSFNALLKTLEEPPAHVIFILATTELSKIPATIVSRCQRFRFRPIPKDVTVAHLEKLAAAEKIKTDKRALAILARAAGGALRDAVSLLEQAAAFGGGAVTADKAAELMGTLPADFLLGLGRAVLEKDARALSEWLGKSSTEGFDAGQLLRDLRERFQEAHLFRLGVGVEIDDAWKELAADRPAEVFSHLVRRINATLADMRSSDSPQLAFELGVYGLLESAYDLRQWVERLQALEKRLGSGGGGPGPGPSLAPAYEPPARQDKPRIQAPGVKETAPAAAKASSSLPPIPSMDPGKPVELWAAVQARLMESKPSLAGCLERSRLVPSENGPWKICFPKAFNMERAQAYQAALEECLAQAAGRKVSLAFEVDPKLDKPAKTQAKAAGDEEDVWVDASEDSLFEEDPGVKKVLGVLGGRVRQVKKKSS